MNFSSCTVLYLKKICFFELEIWMGFFSRWYSGILEIQYSGLEMAAFSWKLAVFQGKTAYTVELS